MILSSGIAFFVGTGYIALDTAFSYTHTFVRSLPGPDNRNVALYVLYQLWPLICLAGFFLLETVLVLRVLGERKPMRTWCSIQINACVTYIRTSLPHGGGAVVCYRPNLPIRYQHPHLSRNQWQDRRRTFRNFIHASVRCHDMGLLVKYNGRWLAYADIRGEHVYIVALLPRSSFLYDDWCYFSALVPMIILHFLGVYKDNKQVAAQSWEEHVVLVYKAGL